MAVAIILVGVAPGISLLAQPSENRPPIPLLAMTGGFYAVFFGASVFLFYAVLVREGELTTLYSGTTVDGISYTAFYAVLAGLAVMYLSYAILGKLLRSIQCPRFRVAEERDGMATVFMAWVLIALHLAYVVHPAFRSYPSIGQFFGPVGILGLSIVYVKWRRKQLSWHHAAVAFLIFFPFLIIKHLANGYLTPVITLALAPLVLEFWLRGRVPWKSLLALFLVALCIYPFISSLRDRFWLFEQDRSASERMVLVAESLWFNLSNSVQGCAPEEFVPPTPYWRSLSCRRIQIAKTEGYATLYNGLAIRMAHAGMLSHVIKQTPDVVPFWNGETFKPLFTSLVPRVVWSGKPEERAGNEFGRRYGFISDDDQTSINIPWITELFANFGWLGILFGMAVIGAFIRFLERTLSDPSMTDLEVVIGLSVLLPLFYQESNISVMTGSVIPYIICVWLYFSGGLKIFKIVFPDKPSNLPQ